jgi:hypothetical protein
MADTSPKVASQVVHLSGRGIVTEFLGEIAIWSAISHRVPLKTSNPSGVASVDGILAHGIGGSKDLPIPVELVVVGGVAALTISFTVLALAWRTPKYDDRPGGLDWPPLIQWVVGSWAFRAAARAFGLAVFGYAVMVAVLGEDRLTNPIFGIVYTWWWVGLVPLSLLLGPVYRAISPVRTINLAFAKLSGADPEAGIFSYPERLGYWPAALGLYAFVWLELVYPYGLELGPLRLWCAAYVALMLVGGALFGTTFFERADPFEVYSTLVGKLSIWGSREDNGRQVGTWVSPLRNLATVPVRPGLTAVVVVLFGSTAFDSIRGSSRWLQMVQNNETLAREPWLTDVVFNLGLLGTILVVGLIYAAGTMLTPVDPPASRRSLPDRLAHSIVPIVVGYVFAHYLTFLVEYGQQTLIQVSDPFGTGSNWFGTANLTPNYWLTQNPTFLAWTKVSGVILGHVLGVIAAHDRSLALLPKRAQLTGQLPLLMAMVAFTVGGLLLLFAS